MKIAPALALALAGPAAAFSTAAAPPPPQAPVPFVGCASDGQTGPRPAPKAARLHLAPAAVADRLAWFSDGDLGVLGPRGWRCFGLYGSNGAVLIVTPEPHGGDLFAAGSALTGPAIQLSVSDGETSGRFESARLAARLFPSRRDFVRDVIAEGIEPANDFPTGPFPTDRLTRVRPSLVEYETPAGHRGVGTMSRLRPTGDPIRGFAAISDDASTTLLAVRLSAGQRELASAVIGDAEREAASDGSASGPPPACGERVSNC